MDPYFQMKVGFGSEEIIGIRIRVTSYTMDPVDRITS
jgi:hypothetical protein